MPAATDRIEMPQREVAAFCKRHHIRKLSLFGSVLREDFGPDSDVDVLVEFVPDKTPGFIGLAGMEIELSDLVGGRKVDLNTPGFFRPALRKQIQEESMVQYDEAG